MDSHRPRMRMGARSLSHGNQQTLITEPVHEITPSRKITVHSCRICGAMGIRNGIRPNSIHSARENMPRVSMYFLRLCVRLTSTE